MAAYRSESVENGQRISDILLRDHPNDQREKNYRISLKCWALAVFYRLEFGTEKWSKRINGDGPADFIEKQKLVGGEWPSWVLSKKG